MYISTQDGDKPYSSTKAGMNSIMECLAKNCSDLFPIDEHFIRNVNQKTKGMVFYLDKYYDLKTKNWFVIQTDNLPIVYENRLAPDRFIRRYRFGHSCFHQTVFEYVE
jgi:hypothetical protein